MKQLFIINTITAWGEPHRARHQLALALAARNYHIVFVARNEKGNKKLLQREISDNITLITPFFPIDYRFRYRLPIINEYYQCWLFRRLSSLYPDNTVINFDFTAHRIFRFFNKVVYYCNDEYIGNSKYPNLLVNLYHKQCEDIVIKKSIFNVSTSKYLTRKLKAINDSTYEISLGVSPVETPIGYNGMRSSDRSLIRLGLMGVINKRQISLQLINELVDDPAYELVIIGPIEDSFLRGIHHKERVILTGLLNGQSLTNELMNIDIGLALYNLKRVNPGATPNKLWQYLSVGKPVIVSYISNINEDVFPKDSVYLYRKNDSIKELIKRAYTRNTLDKALERIRFSKMHTWDKRAEEFELLLEKYHLN